MSVRSLGIYYILLLKLYENVLYYIVKNQMVSLNVKYIIRKDQHFFLAFLFFWPLHCWFSVRFFLQTLRNISKLSKHATSGSRSRYICL